tara:strand:+ start:286 stop:654 length:369 start_codon:yes stop_codon:yes gene_type:complete
MIDNQKNTLNCDNNLTLFEVQKACLDVMYKLYPELINYIDLSSKYRGKEYVMFRKIYCNLSCTGNYTYRTIGKFIDRDHSTVIYSKNNVEDLLYIKDKIYCKTYSLILKTLKTNVGDISNNI